MNPATPLRSAVVTGATGHLGNVLVRHLRARGVPVKAMVRRTSQLAALEGVDAERVEGDVQDEASLRRAFAGADVVFHVAGLVSLSPRDAEPLAETNVEGTRHVIEACVAAGVRRLVCTSSVQALREPPPGGVLDESAPFDEAGAASPYGRTKAAASQLVQDAARQGRLDTVLVLPTAVVGPHDFLGSDAGALVALAGRGRIPVLIGGGFDWVDVRDVADGTIAAAERGRRGEAYLLSHQPLSNVALCEIIAKAAGVRAPLVAIPLGAAGVLAQAAAAWTAITGQELLLTPHAVRTLGSQFTISNEKARRELGFSPRPIEQTLADAWEWISTHPKSPHLT